MGTRIAILKISVNTHRGIFFRQVAYSRCERTLNDDLDRVIINAEIRNTVSVLQTSLSVTWPQHSDYTIRSRGALSASPSGGLGSKFQSRDQTS
jgi:hypothetical protein